MRSFLALSLNLPDFVSRSTKQIVAIEANVVAKCIFSYDSLTNIFPTLTNFTVFSIDIPYVLATVAPAT